MPRLSFGYSAGYRALVAFYYGNLTHPSQDPPRIGLLSTLPSDANDRLQAVVSAAKTGDGNFIGMSTLPTVSLHTNNDFRVTVTSEPAPSGTFIATSTGIGGVPQATLVQPEQPQHSGVASSSAVSVHPLSRSMLLVLCGTAILSLVVTGTVI